MHIIYIQIKINYKKSDWTLCYGSIGARFIQGSPQVGWDSYNKKLPWLPKAHKIVQKLRANNLQSLPPPDPATERHFKKETCAASPEALPPLLRHCLLSWSTAFSPEALLSILVSRNAALGGVTVLPIAGLIWFKLLDRSQAFRTDTRA